MKKLLLILISGLFFLAACAQAPDAEIGADKDSVTRGTCYNPGVSSFGSHFQSYLNNAGNSDMTGFGGSSSISGDCAVSRQPVIFIHGNADTADGTKMAMGGWVKSRDYFLSKGYKPTELYAVNWGEPGTLNASKNYHSVPNLDKVYRFIKAVKNYTGASKVDVITHSLGVTLARGAIQGGTVEDSVHGSKYLGGSLNNYVDTFVGISGANRGLLTCGEWPLNVWAPTCGPNGLSVNNPYLEDINGGEAYAYYWWGIWYPNTLDMEVGSYTYSIKSWVDEVACNLAMGSAGCYVYSAHTSQLDGENGSKSYYSVPYGHMGAKEYSASVQYNMVANHRY